MLHFIAENKKTSEIRICSDCSENLHTVKTTRITRGARPALPCDLLSFRTLLTNPKVFQTQSNSRNFDATGCCLAQDFDTIPSKIHGVTTFFLMRNFITNSEKNPGVIGWPGLQPFGICRCDFCCHQLTYLPTYLLTDMLIFSRR